MKKLWNKILDFFHIEHHEPGTLRIVRMKDGYYHVQEWKHDEFRGGDVKWRTVKNGIFLDWKAAYFLYEDMEKQRNKLKLGDQISEVCIQEDI